jgi:ABC-type polysaccharide/polyol phosphate export permease
MQALIAFRPFGLDFFCLGKKFLVFNLVGRNLKIKYRRSFFGVLWTLLSPLAMALVYFFVFKVILKVQIPHYLAYILSGILPWTFFAQSLMEGMESLVGNLGLISKVPIPLQIFPYVGTLTNLVTLFLSLPILVGASLLTGVSLGLSVVLLPFYFFLLFLITYSFSICLSLLFVYFRDLRHLMGIIIQIWFYSTPVIYDAHQIPERFRWVLYVNPIGTIFTGLHQVLVRGDWPTSADFSVSLAWGATACVVAMWAQREFGREVVENL